MANVHALPIEPATIEANDQRLKLTTQPALQKACGAADEVSDSDPVKVLEASEIVRQDCAADGRSCYRNWLAASLGNRMTALARW